MKICVLSDLHGNLVEINPCDVLFICGDLIPLRMQMNVFQSKKWFLTTFADWIKSLPCNEVYAVAGNHDFYLAAIHNRPDAIVEIEAATNNKFHYLHENKTFIITNDNKDYTVWGAPYCHKFGSWAFMPGDDNLPKYFEKMPENCDVVITHDPPLANHLGTTTWMGDEVEAGDKPLADEILKKKPKYAFCGHIHDGNHNLQKFGDTMCANTSILDNSYSIEFTPLYLDI